MKLYVYVHICTFSLRYAGEMEITDRGEGTNVISAPLPTRVLVSLYSWYFTGGSLDSANLENVCFQKKQATQ